MHLVSGRGHSRLRTVGLCASLATSSSAPPLAQSKESSRQKLQTSSNCSDMKSASTESTELSCPEICILCIFNLRSQNIFLVEQQGWLWHGRLSSSDGLCFGDNISKRADQDRYASFSACSSRMLLGGSPRQEDRRRALPHKTCLPREGFEN